MVHKYEGVFPSKKGWSAEVKQVLKMTRGSGGGWGRAIQDNISNSERKCKKVEKVEWQENTTEWESKSIDSPNSKPSTRRSIKVNNLSLTQQACDYSRTL